MKNALLIFGLLFALTTSAAEEHYIRSNNDGEIIVLEDGSVWEVDSYDRYDSRYWMNSDDVIITDGEDKMINVDEDESVDVRRIR